MISTAVQSRKGSALVISMFVTVIIIMIAIYLLDKIVPTARDVKGIENGNRAYYQAESAVNEALLAISTLPTWSSTWVTYTGSTQNGIGYQFQILASGNLLPPTGKGTSEYDPDWNRIGPWEPVQLLIPRWSGIDWNTVALRLRVPNLSPATILDLSGSSTPFVNWILSSESGSLIASGSYITKSGIGVSRSAGNTTIFGSKSGMTPEWSGFTLQSFHGTNCGATNDCVLKLSIAAPLSVNDTSIGISPYLEYQFNAGVSLPLQHTTITTRGYSAGFRKDITRSIRQKTSNEAADFTVFQ